jgi:hypothetical protein
MAARPGREAEGEAALVARYFLALRRPQVASGEWTHPVYGGNHPFGINPWAIWRAIWASSGAWS